MPAGRPYARGALSGRNVRRAAKRLRDRADNDDNVASDGSDSDAGQPRAPHTAAFEARRLERIAGGPLSRQRSRLADAEEADNLAENRVASDGADSDDASDASATDLRETAAEKRLRLAKEYLSVLRDETRLEQGDVDAAYLDRQILADRLRDDNLEAYGKLFHPIADAYLNIQLTEENGGIQTLHSARKPHQLALTATAVAVLPLDDTRRISTSTSGGDLGPLTGAGDAKVYLFSASKDASIAKWDFDTGKLVSVTPGGLKPTARARKAYGSKFIDSGAHHNDCLLTLACSKNGRYLASGGFDKSIQIWDTITGEHIKEFKQHRDSVSGLVFRDDYAKSDLYSVSFDRTVKVWSIDALTYVETLFGHQDKISAITALKKERCVTVGSQDRTARLWKIPEESQLVFRGSGAQQAAGEDLVVKEKRNDSKSSFGKQEKNTGQNIDAVAMIDDNTFVTGGDNGSIALWSVTRKKPVYIKAQCHGPGSLLAAMTVKNPTPKTLGEFFDDDDKADSDAESNSEKMQDGTNEVTLNKTKTKKKSSFSQRYEKLSLATRGCRLGQPIPKCIISLAALPNTDLFVSGGGDGYLRLWKVSADKRKFGMLSAIKIDGFINHMSIFEAPPQDLTKTDVEPILDEQQEEAEKKKKATSTATERLAMRNAMENKKQRQRYILVAVGQEHKVGRWWKRGTARNSLKLVRLDHNISGGNDDHSG